MTMVCAWPQCTENHLNKRAQFRKSDFSNRERNIKLPRDDIFFGNECEIMEMITRDMKMLQSLSPFYIKKRKVIEKKFANLDFERRCI